MSDTARVERYAGTPIQKTALIVGIVFLLVGIAGFIPVNNADNWLHLVLGIGMILLGVFVSRAPRVPGNDGRAARA